MLLEAVLILTILIISIYIMFIDIQKKLIYDEAILALGVPAIVSFFVFPEVSFGSRLLGAVSVSGIMLLVNIVRPGAFGGGDMKLMVPLGFWLGFSMTLLTGILAVCIGAVWGIMWMLVQGKEQGITIPFAPSLCIGAWISYFWGEALWQWLCQ